MPRLRDCTRCLKNTVPTSTKLLSRPFMDAKRCGTTGTSGSYPGRHDHWNKSARRLLSCGGASVCSVIILLLSVSPFIRWRRRFDELLGGSVVGPLGFLVFAFCTSVLILRRSSSCCFAFFFFAERDNAGRMAPCVSCGCCYA